MDDLRLLGEGAVPSPFKGDRSAPSIIRTFKGGATRDTEQGKISYLGILSPRVLRRFGLYMSKHRAQRDGSLRNWDNWKAGMPRAVYLDSLLRHVQDLHYEWENKQEEPEVIELLCATLFNCQGLLHELLLGRSLDPDA